jgi:IS30 family transposase
VPPRQSTEETRILALLAQGWSTRAIAVELHVAYRTLRRKLGRLGITRERNERMVNEQPWEPLPGMVKRRCERCHYWFATPERAQCARCTDCRGVEET